jgi:hypothetical protein
MTEKLLAVSATLADLSRQVKEVEGTDEAALRRFRAIADKLRMAVYDIGMVLDEARIARDATREAGEAAEASLPRGMLGSAVAGDPEAPEVGPTVMPPGAPMVGIAGLHETEGANGEIVDVKATRWEVGRIIEYWHDQREDTTDLCTMGETGSREWRIALYAAYRIDALWLLCAEEKRHELQRDACRRARVRRQWGGRSFQELVLEQEAKPPTREQTVHHEVAEVFRKHYGHYPWVVVHNFYFLLHNIILQLEEVADPRPPERADATEAEDKEFLASEQA